MPVIEITFSIFSSTSDASIMVMNSCSDSKVLEAIHQTLVNLPPLPCLPTAFRSNFAKLLYSSTKVYFGSGLPSTVYMFAVKDYRVRGPNGLGQLGDLYLTIACFIDSSCQFFSLQQTQLGQHVFERHHWLPNINLVKQYHHR